MSSDKHLSQHTEQPSALDTFSLAFEYDVSWTDARKAIKKRAA